MIKMYLYRLGLIGCFLLLLFLAVPATGQSAYFSLKGDVNTVGDQVDFLYDQSRSVGSAEDMRFVTFTESGGTNAAGEIIAGSGFNSLVQLFDSLADLRGQDSNDGPGLDALLSWSGITTGNPLNPDPLAADSYRLHHEEFNNNDLGPWAVDLIGPADAITLTGVTPTGTGTIKSLNFGTTGGGTAVYTQDAGTLALQEGLVVAQTGDGTLNILNGGTVSSTFGYIADIAGSTGTVNVNGAGSTWTNSSVLRVGRSGNGMLNILNGGSVTNTGLFTTRIAALSGSTGEVTVDGAGSSWAITAIDVGYSSTGTLNILNGGSVSTSFNATLGDLSFSDGGVVVDGTGSIWTIGGELTLGYDGNGSLEILNGGEVTNTRGTMASDPGGTGSATVNGAGSMWTNTENLYVGYDDTGVLDIQNGGTVSNIDGIIGDDVAVTGTATVTGAGSTWINSELHVGEKGNGTLNVEAGGAVTSGLGFIGFSAGSTGTATVTGAGSTWTNTSDLHVGGDGSSDGGSANLAVEDGGLVEVGGTMRIWGPGTVTINSAVLALNALEIDPGGTMAFNTGTLQFTNFLVIDSGDGLEAALGGSHAVSAGQTLQVDNTAILNTTLTVSGGTFTTNSLVNPHLLDFQSGTLRLTGSGGLTIGAAGLFGDQIIITGDQTIDVTNLTTVEADGTLIVLPSGGFSSGGLTNLGTAAFIDTTIGGPIINPTGSAVDVIGDVTFTGHYSGGGDILGSGTADFQGGFSPGDSPAQILIEGSVSFAAGNTLFIEIGGLTPGTGFDALDVVGNLTAGGTLDISLINAFDPNAGDSFDILDWGSITGTFSTIDLPALTGDLDWDTSNLLIDGTLSVFSTTLPGDLDGDGFVGINDLNIVLANWNQNVPPANPLSDPSGDGFVGIDDLNVVLGNWNAGTPPTATAHIPEPTTLTLLTLGAMTVSRRRTR